jgi:hypothetical protein
MPDLKGCLISAVSLTRSAAAITAWGALRPVKITLVRGDHAASKSNRHFAIHPSRLDDSLRGRSRTFVDLVGIGYEARV